MKKEELTPDEVLDFGERAGIREYDGGMSRADAEAAALQDIEERRKRKNGK